MPWEILTDHPDCAGFAVVKQGTTTVLGCHPTKADANKQVAALYANEEAAMTETPTDERATWSTEYVNALPDSAFACIDSSGRHYPHHDASGAVDPAHLANARARVQQQGTTSCGYDHLFHTHHLPSDSASAAEATGEVRADPPPAEGYRAISTGPLMRDTADGRPTLFGHFARFGVFNEIDSAIEGRFLERIERGAFKKTFAENRPKILFQHGKDPDLGDKPIAAPGILREDESGPYFEDELLDGVPPLIVAGLRAGQYGVSYRFRVVREDWEPKPAKSDLNPHGLPERTIREAKVYEYGPVTFPADAGATVMVRSLSDQMSEPSVPVAPSLDAAADEPHLEPERREEPEPPPPIAAIQPEDPPDGGSSDSRSRFMDQITTYEDKVARANELRSSLERLAHAYPGVLPEAEQAQWLNDTDELKALQADITAYEARQVVLAEFAARPTQVEAGATWAPPAPPTIIKRQAEGDIYDVARTVRDARNQDHLAQSLRDNAMRAVEGARFQTTERAKGQGEIESLLSGVDQVEPTAAAKRVLYTGSPAYRRAYRKFLTQGPAGPMFTAEEGHAFEEARTALVTASNTAVPFDLDPTMVINTSGAVNPFRAAFRIVRTTSNDWRPSVSSGMTAVYEDEATAATDLSPAFTAPARLLVKAHTAATFSVEIEGDYALGSLEAELSKEIADAKDVLEATEFSTGDGATHHPNGIFNYYTANFLDTATTLVIVPADLYKLEANIGPRYRGNTVWLGSPYFYSLVRGIDTAGGAGLWVDNLSLGNFGSMDNNGRLGNLLGHPAYECIAPANTSMASTEKVAILAARDRFVIIDRIGMNIELIPNFLDATTGYPTGQRMVYAWWRNTSVGIGTATLGAGRAACIFRGK